MRDSGSIQDDLLASSTHEAGGAHVHVPDVAQLADGLASPLTHESGKQPFRSPELDGLRGIAVALVVLFHTPAAMLDNAAHSSFATHLLKAWTIIHDSGWVGVDIFFALSGFLITRILLESKEKPHYYRNFYVRRVLRIMPLYLLIITLVGMLRPHSGPFLALCLVYLANFARAFGQYVSYPVLWSLSVEEHFYLIWPTAIRKLNRRHAAYAGVAVCLLSPVARAVAFHAKVLDPLFSWYRFDGFMYGALVAILFTSTVGSSRNLLRWAYGVGFGSLFLVIAGTPFQIYTRFSLAGATLLYSCVAGLASAVIAYVIARPGAAFLSLLRNPILRLLGDISFWVYLIHDFFLDPLKILTRKLETQHSPILANHPIAYYIGQFVYLGIVCFGSGILVRKYFELPILKLKRNF
jgi:peptidoglycan/LPS O-acetylase OafA/YrhL